MKPIIKKIIDEMIAYTDLKELTSESEFIVKAHNQMGGYPDLMPYVGEIVNWMDSNNDEFDDVDIRKLNLFEEGIDNEYVYNRYVGLFKWVPELTQLFVLNDQDITYNESFSDNDIFEMRQYVADNHEQIPFHAR